MKASAAPGKESTVTLAGYGALHEGITYSEACEIIGTNWTEFSRTDLGRAPPSCTRGKTERIRHERDVQNATLIQKAQFGLK
jgi:hypothetical protein